MRAPGSLAGLGMHDRDRIAGHACFSGCFDSLTTTGLGRMGLDPTTEGFGRSRPGEGVILFLDTSGHVPADFATHYPWLLL
jgi:hypothetical protein